MTRAQDFEWDDDIYYGPIKTIYSGTKFFEKEAIDAAELDYGIDGANDYMWHMVNMLSTTAQDNRAKVAAAKAEEKFMAEAAERTAQIQKHAVNKKIHAIRRHWKR